MKHLFTPAMAVWFFLVALRCIAETAATPQADQLAFRGIASGLITRHPWDNYGVESPQQQQSLKKLRQSADQLMLQPAFAPFMLAMLKEYKDHDTYERQTLMRAVLESSRYTLKDAPFLNDVYLVSLTFHYDEHPAHARGWLDPFAIHYHLANIIENLKGHGNLKRSDLNLIATDPAAWIAKQAP